MKLLFTLIAFCSISISSFAQNDTNNGKPDERIIFQSKVRQLVSYLAEGNESAAGTMFNHVTKKMEVFIKETADSLSNVEPSEGKALKQKLSKQQQLMAQFQSYRSNLIRNKESINTWSEQFINTLY